MVPAAPGPVEVRSRRPVPSGMSSAVLSPADNVTDCGGAGRSVDDRYRISGRRQIEVDHAIASNADRGITRSDRVRTAEADGSLPFTVPARAERCAALSGTMMLCASPSAMSICWRAVTDPSCALRHRSVPAGSLAVMSTPELSPRTVLSPDLNMRQRRGTARSAPPSFNAAETRIEAPAGGRRRRRLGGGWRLGLHPVTALRACVALVERRTQPDRTR